MCNVKHTPYTHIKCYEVGGVFFCPCYFPANISMKWALPYLCCLFLCLCVQSVCSQSAAGKDHPHHQRSDQHHLQWDPQSLCSGNIEHQTVEWTIRVMCSMANSQLLWLFVICQSVIVHTVCFLIFFTVGSVMFKHVPICWQVQLSFQNTHVNEF